MAYDEALAERVRAALAGNDGVTECRMFGGLAFMLDGNMCCGTIGSELVLRLGHEGGEQALRRPHTRPMDFTGKPMKGFVFVAEEGLATDEDLREWVGLAVAFCAGLPPRK